jgi:hypothetical protein
MTTKDMVKNFKKLVSMTDHMFLNEVETERVLETIRLLSSLKLIKMLT